MKNHPLPAISKWYLDNVDGQLFEIVAIDDEGNWVGAGSSDADRLNGTAVCEA